MKVLQFAVFLPTMDRSQKSPPFSGGKPEGFGRFHRFRRKTPINGGPGVIIGFMKVSGQNYLKHLSYDLLKFFFEELKKLSPPKLNHILGQKRLQTLRLTLIFNPTVQFSVDLKNGGVRAKLKILKFWPGNFTFV